MSYSVACYGFALLLASSGVSAAVQCQGKDGAWHDYSDPECTGGAPAQRLKQPETPIEPGASIWETAKSSIEWLVRVIRIAGYNCDSVSGVSGCSLHKHCVYRVQCDHQVHTYQILDYGGKWLTLVE